ncbi:MAG: hypothetical protein L0Y72_31150 [Gemmataceae bacterium]|nr:hypothetical protein [Gemmataceae bacterium]MCI0743508.1 hypothetical protein [Gemmataceae bacterium]
MSRWQSADIRRREDALSVWDLRLPRLFSRRRRQRREAVATCRRELLTALLASTGPIFLMHKEPPKEYAIPGNWRSAGEASWVVPADFNLDDPVVRHWLFDLGDWRFYSSVGPVAGKWPDVFRCGAAELLAWMSANAVRVLIESFHDDTEWVVAQGTADT